MVDVTTLLALYHTLRCRLLCRFHFLFRESNSFICFSYFAVFSLATSINESESDSESHSVVSNSLWSHGLYSPWSSLSQNTEVHSLPFLQGIFPTQGLNPGLPHCRQILHQLSHKGSPRILEWVAYPFSSGSSRTRNRTGVSCIAGGFFTKWDIRRYHLIVQTYIDFHLIGLSENFVIFLKCPKFSHLNSVGSRESMHLEMKSFVLCANLKFFPHFFVLTFLKFNKLYFAHFFFHSSFSDLVAVGIDIFYFFLVFSLTVFLRGRKCWEFHILTYFFFGNMNIYYKL